ncbi:MAG: quinone oxidoreductase [Alphaproteobacteria bacterium]|nr:quinone oxidoreductase [Alphaproteobacteria bacterium]
MTRALILHNTGGPEAFSWEEVAVPSPGEGEVRLQQTAVGVNFLDLLFRRGVIPLPPSRIIGWEGVGIVDATGSGVEGLNKGDRVAYVSPPGGAYAEVRLLPARDAVPLPAHVSDAEAAAGFLKGMTAQYLVRQTYAVKAGDTILIHAAAGGVGLMVCQWAKHLGARVVGTVSTDAKAELAMRNGCDHAIVYTREDVAARVRELTGGGGVDAIYDSVGKDTFVASAASVKAHGVLVCFGGASGPVAAEDFNKILYDRYVIRTTLQGYTATRADLLATAQDLFTAIKAGVIRVPIGKTLPLRDAGRAHADLESRRSTAAFVLTV